MKLWQKIFLSSLALIILTVNIVSVILLNNNHRLIIELEQSHAVNEHEYFTSAFINAVTYEKTASGTYVLYVHDINKIAVNLVNSQMSGIAIYNDNKIVVSKNISNELNSLVRNHFIDYIDTSGDKYGVNIFDCDGRKIMVIGSTLQVESTTYYIVTSADISEIYVMYQEQSDFVRKVSIIASATVSMILLIMTIILLRPLKILNMYTKK